MFVEKKEYIDPEIEVVKFGSEDIMTSSTEDHNFETNDPWYSDIF